MNILDIAIASISFLTFREKILLQKNIDTLDRLVILSIEELSSIIGRSVKSPWQAQSIAKLAEFSLKIIETKGIQAVRYDDEDFPPLLREIFDPPYMIFYRGNLNALQKKCISIVGTRKVCEEAAKSTLDFAKEAALDNRLIISGLANGIDSFAHRGALSSCVGASTAAVLPCGIDTIVPTANKKLADHILRDNGCFLSEYIPGTPAEKWRFVQRNRLIAALSPAVLVCQAPAGSGALITADFALEYNRDVLREFLATYNGNDDKDTWWNKIVAVAEKCGIKPGDVAMNLRVAMTGRTNTPDLYSLMVVLGDTRVRERINMII